MDTQCRASHSAHGHSAAGRGGLLGLGLGQPTKRPGPTATRPKPAWLCGWGVNAPAAVTVCGAPAMAWLPAAARSERRGEVWRWGTGGEGGGAG
jgi:hypothetical protein